ncbi:MAG: hypothetical protein KatS3mg087_1800 [Patescibacteria group bacterium]|nr:MAG: hypothetical protein KatS3mg087_1800 [Patescibacteria group bacterium]
MTLLSDKQLGYMREQVLSMLPETASIQVPTIVSDAGGGWVETWTTKATYPCRLETRFALSSVK